MSETLLLTSYQPAELKSLIQDCINETFEKIIISEPKHDKTQKLILSRQETADLLKISLPTLDSYTRQGIINAYRLGHKVRYKLEEVNKSLTKINVGGKLC